MKKKAAKKTAVFPQWPWYSDNHYDPYQLGRERAGPQFSILIERLLKPVLRVKKQQHHPETASFPKRKECHILGERMLMGNSR
ncbi:hypothetical protein [Noviherbaspirillum aerium]|uniref:hypothetical protein n=1 Tax=Noviherbaspirillum aerium TaxID=2588497 RepID=UPI00124D5254|nr:hypothetical protein [Noviherbaspirillum aerium]